jgi:signal transduction histidine kinase
VSSDHTGALTARLLGTGLRLRHFDAAHRWVLDTAGVLAVFVFFALPDLVHRDRDADLLVTKASLTVPQTVLWQLAIILPLWWRRRAPLPAFYAVSAVFLAQWYLHVLLRADFALLVALYSLVLQGRPRHLIAAVPPLIAALILVTVRLSGALAVADVMFILIVVGTSAVALGFAVRLRRAQLAVLRDRAVQAEIERDQRGRLAAATERTRVAREMHDVVGHSLAVIVTLADAGQYALDTDPERGREALHLIGDTSRRSLAELRRALGVLREPDAGPNLSPQPGIADLDRLCHRIRAAGPRIDYRSTGDLAALDVGVQLAAYRIVQEALTNTLKHAGPHTTVELALSAETTRLRILVRDTGPPGGVARPAAVEQAHGLIGMRERAALYGGTVAAGPAPGGGWTVTADLEVPA